MSHKYTKDQKEFIKNNYKGRKALELTELVNKKFGLELTYQQIRAYLKNHGYKNGVSCQFKKGQSPPNKGTKGITTGGIETQFKKGQMPYNYVPVGSERVNGDDYVDIKIADPNKWKGKHILVWEKHNGPVPKGYVVLFGDGNNRNFELDNLILVSRRQLLILNKKRLIQKDADLTRTGVIIADLYQKISEAKGKAK